MKPRLRPTSTSRAKVSASIPLAMPGLTSMSSTQSSTRESPTTPDHVQTGRRAATGWKEPRCSIAHRSWTVSRFRTALYSRNGRSSSESTTTGSPSTRCTAWPSCGSSKASASWHFSTRGASDNWTPGRSTAYRQAMVSLALLGQRAAALGEYEICRRVLRSELGVEPSEQTEMLAQQLRRGLPLAAADAACPRQPSPSVRVHTAVWLLSGKKT